LTLIATMLTTGFPPVSPPAPVAASIDGAGLRVGLRRLRQDAPSRAPIAVVGVDGVVEGAVDVLLVVLAIDVLMLGDGGPGYLNAALGVGAIIGGLGSYALVGRRNLSLPLLVTGLLTGAAMLLIAVLPGAAVMVAAAGVGYGVIAMITKTMLQRLTPGQLMGRMFGWLEGVQLGGLALGSALAPLAIAWVGAPTSFGLFGLAIPIVVLVMWRRLSAADREADTPTEAIEALRDVEVISALPPEALEALARGATIRRTPPGTILVTEGTAGHEMYVIRDGRVEVSRGGELVATLGPGDIFGEIAVLSDAPRIATVSTVTDTVVLAIGRDAFLAALSTDPATRYGVEVLAATRRSETLG
jgi:MFS family permease